MWYTSATAIKVFLCIGILLLIIAFFYIYKDWYMIEPFQTSANFCSSDENKCSLECNTGLNDPLPQEIPNEQYAYDLYEAENLKNIEAPSATPIQPFNPGSQLSDFTVGASVPWDYDNRMMNPQSVLWGIVMPSCSSDIYYKAYHRQVYGSGNNMEYNPADPTGPAYVDPIFGIGTDDAQMAVFLEAADFLFQTIGGLIVNEPIKYLTLGTWNLEAYEEGRRITDQFKMDARRGFSVDPSDEFVKDKNGRPTAERTAPEKRTRLPYTDPSTGEVFQRGTILSEIDINNRSYNVMNYSVEQYHSAQLASSIEKTISGTETGRAATLTKALEQAGFKNARASATQALNDALQERLAYEKAVMGDSKLSIRKAIHTSGLGRSIERLTDSLKNNVISRVDGVRRRAGLRTTAFIGKPAMRLASVRTIAPFTEKLGRALSFVSKVAEGMGICEGVVTLACLATASPAPSGVGSGICVAINFGITFITQAVIPSILQALTVDDSVCPPGMSTIYDELKQSTGGSDWAFTLLQMIPGPLGDFIGATGLYVCWKVDLTSPDGLLAVLAPSIAIATGAGVAAYSAAFGPCQAAAAAAAVVTFGASLAATPGCIAAGATASAAAAMVAALASIAIGGAIQGLISAAKNSHNPAGYINNLTSTFQPTNDQFKYAGITSALKIPYAYPAYYYDSTLSIFFDNKPQLLNYSGSAWNDPYSYKDSTGEMPIWVDFSDTRLLDAMAQFYNDYSRLFMTSNPDGSVSLQYITKIYAVVASSKYSCDVQCGFNSVTFMPYSGLVLCDIPVPMDAGAATLYHDRRFYFRIDTTRGAQGDARKALTGRERMDDNVAKYVVCGCTNSDGTGPDAIDVTSAAGNQVSDAVVTLGDVFNPSIHSTQAEANTIAQSATIVTANTTQTVGQYAQALALAARNTSGAAAAADANQVIQKAITATGLGVQNSTVRSPAIPGYYYAPIHSDMASLIANTPLNNSCQVTTRAFSRYGNAMESSIQNVRNNLPINTTGAPSMEKMLTPTPWPGAITYYNKHPSAKYFQVEMQDRGVGTAGSPGQIGASFGQNMAENSIPLFAGLLGPVSGLVAGGIVGGMQISGASRALACTYQDARKNDGNFVLNDMLFTSEHKTFVNRGPVITYAPGYTPKIVPCAKVYLQQADCVSRYSIRRFLQKFNTEIGSSVAPASPTYQKVMHLTSIETIQNIGSTTDKPLCLYRVGVATFDRALNKQVGPELPQTYGIQCEITSGDNTCSYKPIANTPLTIYTDSAIPTPKPIVFVNSSRQLTSFPNAPQNPKFQRPTCTDTTYRSLKCDHPTLKASLVRAFNTAHTGSAHLDLKNIMGSYAPTPTSVYDTTTCVYYGNVLDVLKATYNGTYITMNLSPSLTDQCLYTFASDDYPERFYFSSIPAKPLAIPDIPVVIPQTTLPTTGCSTGATTDCSGTAIIQNLVTQFNAKHDNRQIFKVISASTPDATTCDYQVEMSRNVATNPETKTKSNIVLMDSIRMTVRQSSSNPCLYDLVSDTSSQILSTQTFQGTTTPIPLKTPYVWSDSTVKTIGTSLNTYLQSFLGLDIQGALNTTATATTNEVQTVLNQVHSTNMPLSNCPTQKCTTPSVMQMIVNRYNYDNFPTTQYGALQSQITEIRRAGGVPAPKDQSSCQFELIQRVDVYADFLQDPIPSSTQFYLRQYQFYLLNSGQQCTYTVKPLSAADIANNIMDISGNAYGILSDATLLQPYSLFTLKMIPYGDPGVLASVKAVYEKINVAPPRTPAIYNKLVSIQRAFNPRPNVCEYKATVNHTFYDADYGVSYVVKGDTTYLRATWANYTVETNTFTGSPVVEEFFPPQITINPTGVTKIVNGVKTNIVLPYLYFENPSQGPTRVGTGPQGKGWTL